MDAQKARHGVTPQNSANLHPIKTREEIAKLAGVSRDTVDKVKQIEKLGGFRRGFLGVLVFGAVGQFFVRRLTKLIRCVRSLLLPPRLIYILPNRRQYLLSLMRARGPMGGELYGASLNDHRRHDSENERAMVGARMANLVRGGDRKSGEIKSSMETLISIERAAELSGSTPSSERQSRFVTLQGDQHGGEWGGLAGWVASDFGNNGNNSRAVAAMKGRLR